MRNVSYPVLGCELGVEVRFGTGHLELPRNDFPSVGCLYVTVTFSMTNIHHHPGEPLFFLIQEPPCHKTEEKRSTSGEK